jgi:hypothetical protein
MAKTTRAADQPRARRPDKAAGGAAPKATTRRPPRRVSAKNRSAEEAPSPETARGDARLRRTAARQIEQLAVLTLAIIFGVFGLALHGLWIGAIILMALLWGYLASTIRSRRDTGGVVSNVVSTVLEEVRDIADEIADKSPASKPTAKT